mgnify:CR=1 FL=1
MSELAGALAEPTVSVRTPDAPGSVGGDDLCGSLRLGDRYPKARDLLHQHRVRVTGGDGVVHPARADDETTSLSHLQGTALVAAYPNCVRRVCRLGGGGQQGRGHGSGQEQGQDFSVFHARFLRFVIWWGFANRTIPQKMGKVEHNPQTVFSRIISSWNCGGVAFSLFLPAGYPAAVYHRTRF